MRILHIVHTPRYSGAEMLVLSLTKLHAKMGHTSTVVAMFPIQADFNSMIVDQRESNIDWSAPPSKISRMARLWHIRRTALGFNPQVVFAHSVLPAAYARVAGLSNVISVLHDASENDYCSWRIASAEHALQYRSAGVITVSQKAAVNYSKRFFYPKVKCIPNGIELDKYQIMEMPDRTSILESLGLPSDAVIVLQVGRITQIKRQYLSVRAVAPLIGDNPKLHLLLAGIYEDHESLSILNGEIKTYGLEGNVHLIGPREDVPRLLKVANLYLMPSKQEAHSVALLEALASGIAIVASNISTFEYAKNMDGVTLVDPSDRFSYSQAINSALCKTFRFSRDLNDYSIVRTAKLYVDFANSCI